MSCRGVSAVHGNRRLDLAKLEVLLRARLGTSGMVNRYPSEAPEVLQSPPLLSRAVQQPQVPTETIKRPLNAF